LINKRSRSLYHFRRGIQGYPLAENHTLRKEPEASRFFERVPKARMLAIELYWQEHGITIWFGEKVAIISGISGDQEF
jgi:hypothetical protein